MAQIFSPPKKIEATMPSGRKTYRYAGDSDTLKKKIAGLKKSGASGVSVVAEGVSSELGEEISSVADRKARIAKGIYPTNGKGQPNTNHLMFHQYKKGPDGKMGLYKHDGLIKLAQDHAASKNEETIQELSSKTLKNYIKKAASPKFKHENSLPNLATTAANKLSNHMRQWERGNKHEDDGEREDIKAVKRGKGIQKAAKKLYSRTNEENIQEISQDLATSVTKQRKINVGKAAFKADGDRRDPDYQTAKQKLRRNQSLRFHRGARKISKAFDGKRLGEATERLQELSPETVKSFMQKRLKKSVDHNKMAVDAAYKGDKEGYKKHSGLQKKNFDGAMKAIRHAGNTLKRRTGMNEIAQQSIITHNIKSKDSNRPVVKKGTQLEGAFKRQLIDKMEKERLGGGSKPNVERKKPSKAWSDIGYSNEKPKEKKKIHQSFQKGGKNDPGGMGALLHAESVKDYIEVKGGNMSKQEISKLIKNRKKEMEEGKKPGLWDNIHAKRARIKAGSKERMRTPGSKGAPTAQDFKDASEAKEYTGLSGPAYGRPRLGYTGDRVVHGQKGYKEYKAQVKKKKEEFYNRHGKYPGVQGESNVAFKNFLEARQINERKGGATAGFLMRQLYLKRLMKRLNLPVSVAAMIDK